MRAGLFAFLLLIISVASANADWQYSKWGMTVDQVLAASKGQLKKCSAVCDKQSTDGTEAQLYGPYSSGDFEFTAFALFDKKTRKLASIRLRLDNNDKAQELMGALRSKYGEPETKSRTQVLNLAVWRSAGDQISYILIGFDNNYTGTVSYQPRVTDSNKGL